MKIATFYKKIDETKVLTLAIQLVKSAQSAIDVSQNEDEITTVIPNLKYFEMLKRKKDEGIRITRYFFGKKTTFVKEKENNSSITYIYAGNNRNYQRMIIIDKKKALFRIDNSFCYTEFEPLARALLTFCSEKGKSAIN